MLFAHYPTFVQNEWSRIHSRIPDRTAICSSPCSLHLNNKRICRVDVLRGFGAKYGSQGRVKCIYSARLFPSRRRAPVVFCWGRQRVFLYLYWVQTFSEAMSSGKEKFNWNRNKLLLFVSPPPSYFIVNSSFILYIVLRLVTDNLRSSIWSTFFFFLT